MKMFASRQNRVQAIGGDDAYEKAMAAIRLGVDCVGNLSSRSLGETFKHGCSLMIFNGMATEVF